MLKIVKALCITMLWISSFENFFFFFVTFILISYKIKITLTLFVVMAHDLLWVAEVICCIALLFIDLAQVVFSQ